MENFIMYYNTILSQKLQERQAIFMKLSYAEKDREKWKKIFQVNFMSSEESDGNDEEVIEVCLLSWRSDRVTTFLHSLDEKAREEKSPQARRHETHGQPLITCAAYS